MRRHIITVSALVIAACAQSSPPANQPSHPRLDGQWRVEDVDHAGVVDGAEVTIEFGADGKLSGRSACNRYGGDYSYAGGVLTTGSLFSTKMACAPALMDLEAKFLNRLEGALTASMENDGAVSLSDDEGRLLIRRDDR